MLHPNMADSITGKICRFPGVIDIFILIALLATAQGFPSEDKPKAMFYIYEWPQELDDLWPPEGAELHPKSGYRHDFRGDHNNGAGTLLDPRVGLFNTWQFSLYRNLMNRLRVSEYRTRDPEKATSFIIPVDLGVNSYIDHRDGKPRLASPHGWAACYFLINACNDQKLWWKNHGHDHFVIFSITAYQMVGIGTKVFFMQICQNCSTITIETSPTRTAIKGRTRKHTYAVPYPSSFHWYDGIQQLPWLPEGSAAQRSITATLTHDSSTISSSISTSGRILSQSGGGSRANDYEDVADIRMDHYTKDLYLNYSHTASRSIGSVSSSSGGSSGSSMDSRSSRDMGKGNVYSEGAYSEEYPLQRTMHKLSRSGSLGLENTDELLSPAGRFTNSSELREDSGPIWEDDTNRRDLRGKAQKDNLPSFIGSVGSNSFQRKSPSSDQQRSFIVTRPHPPAPQQGPQPSGLHSLSVPVPISALSQDQLVELDHLNGKQRDIMTIFIGSVRTSQPTSNNLRKMLYEQCNAAPDHHCQWHKTSHTCNGVVNATATMLLMRRSVFCPAPTGDSITRKSLFDSLVAGCIPVLFSRASLAQYVWHLSEEQVDNVSVYVPMKAINEQGADFLQILRDIPEATLRAKQRAIAEIAPTLQYSVVPPYVGNGSDPSITWRPPFRDAADVIIEKILDRQTVAPMQGFTDEELLDLVDKQNHIMDTHEDYAALRGSVRQKQKEQIAKGRKGISKIVTCKTVHYPSYGALINSKDFLPASVFKSTDVVEYKDGKIRYTSDSPLAATQLTTAQ